jgi:hypothetical protein
MTSPLMVVGLVALALGALSSCSGASGQNPATMAPPASAGAQVQVQAPPAAGLSVDSVTGSVAEAINSGGYTYVRLETGKGDVWFAATQMPVKIGERLVIPLEMPMQNFRSTTLEREFALIYFVSQVAREGQTLATPLAQPGAPDLVGSHTSAPPSVAVERMRAPQGGMSIAEVWAKRTSLAGKAVLVRGKVVKASEGIMDRNWFHLQDGSGSSSDGTNDLTVTTAASVKVGDTVAVSGVLAVKKDFGAGYAYEAILENATLVAP